MASRPSIGVIGLGLIGGSLARVFQAEGFTVFGYDTDGRTMVEASRAGVIANPPESGVEAWLDRADWVFLAVPLGQVGAWAERIASARETPLLLVDVGSAKAPVMAALGSLPGHIRVLSLHPMAGREKSGFAASSADLFRGRPCVLVPVPGRKDGVDAEAATILGLLGMRPVRMEVAEHDFVAALVSHLPYLASAALLVTAEDQGRPVPAWPQMAGPGFLDMSRVGSSNPDLWEDILGANREQILPVLDAFVNQLVRWRSDLAGNRSLSGLERTPAIRRGVETLCN